MKDPAVPRVMPASTHTTQTRRPSVAADITPESLAFNVFDSFGFFARSYLPASTLADIQYALETGCSGALAAGFSTGTERTALQPPRHTLDYRRKR